jgi:hypothetical protein
MKSCLELRKVIARFRGSLPRAQGESESAGRTKRLPNTVTLILPLIASQGQYYSHKRVLLPIMVTSRSGVDNSRFLYHAHKSNVKLEFLPDTAILSSASIAAKLIIFGFMCTQLNMSHSSHQNRESRPHDPQLMSNILLIPD